MASAVTPEQYEIARGREPSVRSPVNIGTITNTVFTVVFAVAVLYFHRRPNSSLALVGLAFGSLLRKRTWRIASMRPTG